MNSPILGPSRNFTPAHLLSGLTPEDVATSRARVNQMQQLLNQTNMVLSAPGQKASTVAFAKQARIKLLANLEQAKRTLRRNQRVSRFK
jgi:ElaB/YqjD/DUF883 family membrane-anchored ribosome-binding protein